MSDEQRSIGDATRPSTLEYARPGSGLERLAPETVDHPAAIFAVACCVMSAILLVPASLGGLHGGEVLIVLVASLTILLGVIAKRTKRGYSRRSRTMGTAAVWGGGAQFAILLAMFVLAALPRPPHGSSRPKCASNMRQIGQGLLLYTNDYGPKYPPTLELLIEKADLGPNVFVCPLADQRPAAGATTREVVANFRADPKAHCSYVYLGATMHANLPAEHIVAYEPLENHGDGMNVLFNDGHVEWIAKDEAAWIISELKAGRNPPTTRPVGVR